MSIFDEAQQIEHLAVIGKSLVKYAMSLEPGLVFERKSGGWLPKGDSNFVGFQFQWTNSVSIVLTLYGLPEEQFDQTDLELKKGGYNSSRCRITKVSQLMAASVCIWRAHTLYHQERNQESGKLMLIDETETDISNWLRPRPEEATDDDPSLPNANETKAWYNEVKHFMKKNRLIDSFLLPD
ncbi:MAG: hypothetical protein AAF353_09920 [Pseudomonadota bacterium]